MTTLRQPTRQQLNILRNGVWRYENPEGYDEPVSYGKAFSANGATSFPTYGPDGGISGQCQIFIDEMPLADAMNKFRSNVEDLMSDKVIPVSSRKMRVPFHIEDTVLA